MHEIQEILITQSRIEGKVDRLVSDYESEKETRKRRNEMIDARLSAIENWQAKWAGLVIGFSVVASILSVIAFVVKQAK